MRRAVPILAIVSLLLCVMAVGCWARSLLAESYRVGSISGALALASIDCSDEFLKQVSQSDRGILESLAQNGTSEQHLLGFAHVRGSFAGANYWLIAIPYWFIVLLTAALPAWWWLTWRRTRRRRATGRCPACGYD